MNKKILSLVLISALMGGCRSTTTTTTSIVSMQMVDRNGFSETISNQDRLKVYQNVNFLASQPYEKVLRVYRKDGEGKSPSKLTTYHANGGPWQYLEAIDGRAHGKFLEWHENGKLKIEGYIIEGLADLSEMAQKSWLFDATCKVFDEEGSLMAEFCYDKGLLEQDSNYYYPDGTLQRRIPYAKGLAHGTMQVFDPAGKILEEVRYKNGTKDGKATASWENGNSRYQELYREGKLINGAYFDLDGSLIAEIDNGDGVRAEFREEKLYSLVQYQKGVADGQVQFFAPEGYLICQYTLHGGKKNGEEWEYYPSDQADPQPKLLVNWVEDQIQGMVKTWYTNGALESQREMSGNKKHGISFAYYKSGDLMLMEEYETDQLVKGSYFKKGHSDPISTLENGEGIVSLYTPEGYFIKKSPTKRASPF
jgi:antitoxin component YwqK of YwqJK toxin-antitoxin module